MGVDELDKSKSYVRQRHWKVGPRIGKLEAYRKKSLRRLYISHIEKLWSVVSKMAGEVEIGPGSCGRTRLR